ncbi:MAG: carbohydrate porin [Gammaproteobacteria bacterium]|nr:carbohydrate porin [Gammaproteobacteria bacterium]
MTNKIADLSCRISLLVMLLISQSSVMATEFHGYIRSGVGTNEAHGDQVCFKLPSAAAKYRLGNECESYAELTLSEKVLEKTDGAYFKLATTLAFVVDAAQDWEPFAPSWREVYVEGGQLLKGKTWHQARFWAGKKFYRRHDVHINDFYFWDNSGPGAGIEDISLGRSKLAYAWRRNNETDERAITQHDLRWYELDTNKNGQLTLGVNLIFSDSSQPGFAGENGEQLHLLHQQNKVLGGFNKLAVQYGKASGSTLNNAPDDTLNSSDTTYRIVEQLLMQKDQSWSAMLSVIHEQKTNKQTWQSFGIRPVYHYSEHTSLALEIGYDTIKPEAGERQQISKLTISAQLSSGYGFWSRPVLRAFVTYADWNRAAQLSADLADLENPAEPAQTIGSNGVFGTATHGLTYGFQAEAWW